MRGQWEMYNTEFIASQVKSGMTVLDVGANYGYFSLLMAQLVGPKSGQVIVFEAKPFLCSLLEESISVNGFNGRVAVNNIASSDEHLDDAAFFVPPQKSMNGQLILSRESTYQGKIPKGC